MTNFDPPKNFADKNLPKIDEALMAQIQLALTQKFGHHLKDGEAFLLSGWGKDEEVYLNLQVGTEKTAEVFDVATIYPDDKHKDDHFSKLLDYVDGVLHTYFEEDRDARLPLDYTQHTFKGMDIVAKQEWHNFELEAQANALLAE